MLWVDDKGTYRQQRTGVSCPSFLLSSVSCFSVIPSLLAKAKKDSLNSGETKNFPQGTQGCCCSVYSIRMVEQRLATPICSKAKQTYGQPQVFGNMGCKHPIVTRTNVMMAHLTGLIVINPQLYQLWESQSGLSIEFFSQPYSLQLTWRDHIYHIGPTLDN